MRAEGVAIRLRGVSKHYELYARPEDRLKQSIVPRLQRMAGRPPTKFFHDFIALGPISFDIRRGETVGVVGRNGSGKSTLLQLVCGTLWPTSGSIDVDGRVSALLELGAGFDPQFTGRENVYLNGAILGVARDEMHRRFDDIARFADIGEFIDQPLKTYSSGMAVRLAFATAINVDADILVVDEALAVGDEAFQRKCYARIEDFKSAGGTILFVSHSTQTVVQLCTRAMLLDAGELLLDGDPKTVTHQYQRLTNVPWRDASGVRAEIRALASGTEPSGADVAHGGRDARAAAAPSGGGWHDASLVSHTTVSYEGTHARIEDVRFVGAAGEPVNVLMKGKRYRYEYRVRFVDDASDVSFGMLIKSVTGVELAGANNDRVRHRRVEHARRGESIAVSFDFVCGLMPGVYFTNAGVMATVDGERRFLHRLLDAVTFRVIDSSESLDYGFFGLGCDMQIRTLRGDGAAAARG
jgi:lipopolysaccharide transport system ATP-binding protein